MTGFCARTFGYAAHQKDLQTAGVFYGDAPGSADSTQETALANVVAPVIGMHAGNDARNNATSPATQAAMQKLGKKAEVITFEGAGHGFVGNQAGAAGANLKATQQAWPMLVTFFNKQLKWRSPLSTAQGRRVAVAIVPAAHTSPFTFQYIARSTTIGRSPMRAIRPLEVFRLLRLQAFRAELRQSDRILPPVPTAFPRQAALCSSTCSGFCVNGGLIAQWAECG